MAFFDQNNAKPFTAQLSHFRGEKLEKLSLTNQGDAESWIQEFSLVYAEVR